MCGHECCGVEGRKREESEGGEIVRSEGITGCKEGRFKGLTGRKKGAGLSRGTGLGRMSMYVLGFDR